MSISVSKGVSISLTRKMCFLRLVMRNGCPRLVLRWRAHRWRCGDRVWLNVVDWSGSTWVGHDPSPKLTWSCHMTLRSFLGELLHSSEWWKEKRKTELIDILWAYFGHVMWRAEEFRVSHVGMVNGVSGENLTHLMCTTRLWDDRPVCGTCKDTPIYSRF